MRKVYSGTVVIEFNHSGCPESAFQPEEFDERKITVLKKLDPVIQEKIRKGNPIAVLDKETGAEIARYNTHNIKPSDSDLSPLASYLARRFCEWSKDPENVKKLREEMKRNEE